ncbi:MAG: mitochondrial fission ELM1 family protein [Pseudomonadota bacterium]|nr:mitochondrial fission ELM1 family protein [Pseudomonadota bacterium]
MTHSEDIWTLSDGHAGNLRQAVALADALASPPVRNIVLEPRAPWRWTAPRVWPGAKHAFGREFANALHVAPRIAIGCGRQAALATRVLRAHGSKAVQILDPRIDPAHWDVVIAPQHDAVQGANVVSLSGSLHPVDDPWLRHAREQFVALSYLPRPRIAVLLGGSSRHAHFDRAALDSLANALDAVLARESGSLLLSGSRRTPQDVRAALRARDIAAPHVRWLDVADGDNPYAGMLAWADRIVCTPDSVNMISEACATYAPVFVFDPARAHGRPRIFLDSLLARGRIRAMDDALAPFDVEPLRETARVANEVRERLGLST